MRYYVAFPVACFLALVCLDAHATEQAQAREVARLNNCPVKKIEVYQNSLGETGQTIYRVQCNMPKAEIGRAHV